MTHFETLPVRRLAWWLSWLALGCSDGSQTDSPSAPAWTCETPEDVRAALIADPSQAPDYLERTGCRGDFDALASQPLDASLPGARSGKVILDLYDGDKLYFQNSNRYPIHYEFAKAHLDQQTSPLLRVGTIADFNPQYTLPESERRFLLGAVTYYETPNVWALEMAPYDTATPALIEKLFRSVQARAYYGAELKFHPTSDGVQDRAAELSPDVPVMTSAELYANIDYQPLNLGEAVGPIRFVRSTDLETVYLTSRDIVVLDGVPNDIAPVAGIITEEFQTPLAHINVLMRARGRPNMSLRGARSHPSLAGLADGDLVRLSVGAFEFEVQRVSIEESNAWWEAHRPSPVTVPSPDLSVTDLRDIEQVTEHSDESPYVTREAVQQAIRAFGGKAANYSVFSTDPRVPS
jgi:pyruvate, water dikinase